MPTAYIEPRPSEPTWDRRRSRPLSSTRRSQSVTGRTGKRRLSIRLGSPLAACSQQVRDLSIRSTGRARPPVRCIWVPPRCVWNSPPRLPEAIEGRRPKRNHFCESSDFVSLKTCRTFNTEPSALAESGSSREGRMHLSPLFAAARRHVKQNREKKIWLTQSSASSSNSR